jgi:hypothetical protein
MIITPCPHGLEDLIGRSVLPRSRGVHISQIYGDLHRRLDPTRFTGGEPDPLLLEAGLAWETILEEGLKARMAVSRPGEFVSPEGIKLSPDLVMFNGSVKVGEIKLTWMSCKEMPVERSNHLPPKFSHWLRQIQFYCSVLDTDQARLIAFFVNGDYGKSRGPRLLAWDMLFTQRELNENYQMLIRHGEEMGLLRNGQVVEQG